MFQGYSLESAGCLFQCSKLMAAALIPRSYAPLPPKKEKIRSVRAHQFEAIDTPASATAIKPAAEPMTRPAGDPQKQVEQKMAPRNCPDAGPMGHVERP